MLSELPSFILLRQGVNALTTAIIRRSRRGQASRGRSNVCWRGRRNHSRHGQSGGEQAALRNRSALKSRAISRFGLHRLADQESDRNVLSAAAGQLPRT